MLEVERCLLGLKIGIPLAKEALKKENLLANRLSEALKTGW
jgi:hypothetical protein